MVLELYMSLHVYVVRTKDGRNFRAARPARPARGGPAMTGWIGWIAGRRGLL
jgi:hypothetical protein